MWNLGKLATANFCFSKTEVRNFASDLSIRRLDNNSKLRWNFPTKGIKRCAHELPWNMTYYECDYKITVLPQWFRLVFFSVVMCLLWQKIKKILVTILFNKYNLLIIKKDHLFCKFMVISLNHWTPPLTLIFNLPSR